MWAEIICFQRIQANWSPGFSFFTQVYPHGSSSARHDSLSSLKSWKFPFLWYAQGHPTNLFLTLSVPHRNLAGWQNIRCSNELAGKFLIVRGFGWELLTFLAFQAGLAEKLWRPRTTEKKYPFPPPRVVTNIWRLAREIAFAEKTGFVPVIFARDFKARGCLHMYRSKNFPHLHVRLIPIVILSVCLSSRDVLLHWIETNRVNLTAVICIFIHRFKFRRPVVCVQRFRR